jgi:hypothetical protein
LKPIQSSRATYKQCAVLDICWHLIKPHSKINRFVKIKDAIPTGGVLVMTGTGLYGQANT